MNIEILEEAGLVPALRGLALSYNSQPSLKVAEYLAHKQGGHNKFLESIVVWMEITAPRYWWQQFDTYRVGTTKQSESTMHTIMRDEFTEASFAGIVWDSIITDLNMARADRDFNAVKRNLPESFLQTRVVCTNYKVLQSMEGQRRTHKLGQWQYFLDEVLLQVEKPEWIRKI